LIARAVPQPFRNGIAGTANCSKWGSRRGQINLVSLAFRVALLGGLFVAKVFSAQISQRPAGLDRTAAPGIALVTGNME
jgi:hypothetical protein